MSLTVDSAPATRQLANSASTLSYSFTYAGGSGAIYVAALCTANADISTVTWNGAALTRLITQTTAGASDLEIWRLLNPSGSGAQNVVITLTGSTTYILATTLSLLGNIGAGGATNASATASNSITVANGSWVVIAGSSDSVDVAASTNVTATPTANPVIGYYGPKSGAGSTTLDFTGSGALSVAVEVIDNSAGGSSVPMSVVTNHQGTVFASAAHRAV